MILVTIVKSFIVQALDVERTEKEREKVCGMVSVWLLKAFK